MESVKVEVTKHLKGVVKGNNDFFVEDTDELKSLEIFSPELNMLLFLAMPAPTFFLEVRNIYSLLLSPGLDSFDKVSSANHSLSIEAGSFSHIFNSLNTFKNQ
jgi:hypothetical protein